MFCLIFEIVFPAITMAFGLAVYSVLPMLAALAMGFSSTTVVANSILMKGRTEKILRNIMKPGVMKPLSGST